MQEVYGDPFEGERLARLVGFLAEQGLSYDEGVEHTVALLEGDRIVGTGSVQGNVVKCVAVDPEFRGQNLLGAVMTHLVGWLMEHGVTRYFGYTKPGNRRVFESLGLHAVEETEEVLLLESRRGGLERWLQKVALEGGEAAEAEACGNVGAVVCNCNPFTLGHRYLIEHAASQVGLLHVFVLAEEQPFMPAADRLRLVCEGTADLANVRVHSGGDYLVSPATFPTYFHRQKDRAYQANCELDVRIFGHRVAPALGISRRFVGTEPACPVTARYNECLQRLLPGYGVRVDELPRLCTGDGRVVSASTVRRMVAAGEYSRLAELAPPTTLAYLLARRG